MAKLVFLDGRRMGQAVPLGDSVSFGRDPANAVVLHESGILDRHAVITRVDGAFRLAKADPLARIAVNGTRPAEGLVLRNGDTLTMGPLSLVFSEEEKPAEAADAPPRIDARLPAPRDAEAAIVQIRTMKKAPAALEALFRLAAAVHASVRQSDVIEPLLAQLFALLDPDRAFVLLRDAQGGLQARGERAGDRMRGVPPPRVSRALVNEAMETRTALLTEVALCAPLVSGDRVLGAIHLDAVRRPRFEPDDLVLLNAAAVHAAVALENAAAFGREGESGRARERLAEAGRAVAGSLVTDTVLQEAVAQVCRLFECTKASVLRSEGEHLTVAASNCIDRAVWPAVKIRPGEGYAGKVFKGGKPLLVTDAAGGARAYDTASFAIAPLPERGGVVSVTDKSARGAFTASDLEILAAFAGHLATALANARLYETATLDGLTRVYNRQFADVHLGQDVPGHLSRGEPLAVLLADIDHLKDKNDVYGQATGDRILAETAAIVKAHAAAPGWAARWGAEEFVAVLPGTPADRALDLAKDLRLAVEKHEFNAPEEPLHATVSIGVAALLPGDTPEKLLHRAVQACQSAKRAGRNRVEASKC